MKRSGVFAMVLCAGASLAPFGGHIAADEQPLYGYSAVSSRAEKQWEEKMRAIPTTENLREYMRVLSAEPHNVGTPYDKQNADWILEKF